MCWTVLIQHKHVLVIDFDYIIIYLYFREIIPVITISKNGEIITSQQSNSF